MSLSNREWIFLTASVIVVIGTIAYFKYRKPTSRCIQNYRPDTTYNPNVTGIGVYDALTQPISMEWYTSPPLLISGVNLPYQATMIANYPLKLTRQELEDKVALDGFGIGPGMVEGYRFRGNLNL